MWALTEETELRPRMPGLTDHYESTDGTGGQFQCETNYGQIGKNVSDSAGGQFQARLNESVASNHEVLPIRCV